MRDSFKPKRSFGGSRSGSSRGSNSFDRRDRNSGPREMFDAVCDKCGKDCKVPFRPSNDKPIYCSECFESVERDRDDGNFRDTREPRRSRSFSSNRSQPDNKELEQLKEQLCSMSAKLDKILKIITPKE